MKPFLVILGITLGAFGLAFWLGGKPKLLNK
jgi:hypothetical protein